MQTALKNIELGGFKATHEIHSFGRVARYGVSVVDTEVGTVKAHVEVRTSLEECKCDIVMDTHRTVPAALAPRLTAMISAVSQHAEDISRQAYVMRDTATAYNMIMEALNDNNLDEAFKAWGLCISLRQELNDKALGVELIQSAEYQALLDDAIEKATRVKPIPNQAADFVWESFNKIAAGSLDELNNPVTAFKLIKHVTLHELSDFSSLCKLINELVDEYAQ
ncbi:hypothetical protein [Vibrio crassostreae]|uniref:hypothetical protein n=1 Tax=Vibrio crassostreae TaxID=246167 RepID=UPI001B30F896|nr:hypothetical protein [Vibrio crassostreae]